MFAFILKRNSSGTKKRLSAAMGVIILPVAAPRRVVHYSFYSMESSFSNSSGFKSSSP